MYNEILNLVFQYYWPDSTNNDIQWEGRQHSKRQFYPLQLNYFSINESPPCPRFKFNMKKGILCSYSFWSLCSCWVHCKHPVQVGDILCSYFRINPKAWCQFHRAYYPGRQLNIGLLFKVRQGSARVRCMFTVL